MRRAIFYAKFMPGKYKLRYKVLLADMDGLHLNALYCDGVIYLSKIKNTAEKQCLLAEEYCHYLYSFGDILRDFKQEAIARRKSYEMLVPIERACKDGCCT